MFFMVRSAVCVGIVFCMLPDGGGSATLHDLAIEASRSAASRVEALCATHADCAIQGARVVSAVMTQAAQAGAPLDRARTPVMRPVRDAGQRSAVANVRPRS